MADKHFAIGLVLAGALACGGAEEAPRPSGAPMAAPATAAGATDAAGTAEAPVVERVLLEPEEPVPGGRVRAVVTAADPDGGAVRLRYAWTLNGTPVGGDAPDLDLSTAQKGDELAVAVIANDGARESTPARAYARLGNRPPELVALVLDAGLDPRAGSVVQAVPEARDPDGDVLQYEVTWLVNGEPAEGDGLELDTAPLRRGDRIEAELRASDGRVTTRALRSAAVVLGNSPPEITSRPDLQFTEGVFRYDVAAKDPDGDRNLRFALIEAPKGMTIDHLGGELAWTPEQGDVGTHTVEVGVDDGHGATTVQRFVLTIGSEESTPAAPAAQ